MLFNSITFVIFFITVYAVYLLLKHKSQNVLLLLASYLFYAWWDWRFIILIFLTTLVDFNVARWISTATHPKRYLIISLITHLCVLGFFKYFDFFVDSTLFLLDSIGFAADPVTLHVILPVGISFYTFQSISYVIDSYRRKVVPSENFLEYALYVSFFPQLVAGPIERFNNLMPQFQNKRIITRNHIHEGLWLILFGYYKKVVIADNLSILVDPVFDNPGSHSGAAVLTAVYAFALLIYGDFSGYTDIARGTAKLMGFNLSINFNLPYFANNPSDFWKRWHISLSSWLRDYLYIPLGGNKHGTADTLKNLMLTMLLGGLWHGAAWHYVLWGAYHGILLIGHRTLSPFIKNRSPLNNWFSILLMFHFTCLGWIIFRINHVSDLPILLTDLFSGGVVNLSGLALIMLLASPLLILHLLQYLRNNPRFMLELSTGAQLLITMILYSYILLCGKVDGHEFIYFQF